MRPLQDTIMISKIEKESQIVLPQGVERDTETFRVLEVGPGYWEFGKFIDMPVKKGDIIFTMGKGATYKDGDKNILFARARDVIAVI